jgi:hypothetical protein
MENTLWILFTRNSYVDFLFIDINQWINFLIEIESIVISTTGIHKGIGERYSQMIT